jgi:uncharacterized protein
MKLLLLLVVLAIAVAWVVGRGGRGSNQVPRNKPKADKLKEPAQMLACSHCGVHLPRAEAAFDAAGQPYCSAEHRVAGPR